MERRSDLRQIKTLCPAFIKSDKGLGYAFMRDISHSGASFRGIDMCHVGDEIAYFVGDLGPTIATVKWVDGDVIGVENNSSIQSDLSLRTAHPYRTVRIPVDCAVSIYVNGFRTGAILRDISNTGACIMADRELAKGELLSMKIGRVTVEEATVKWVEDGKCGLKFKAPLDQKVVAAILAAIGSSQGAQLDRKHRLVRIKAAA